MRAFDMGNTVTTINKAVYVQPGGGFTASPWAAARHLRLKRMK